VAVLLAVAAQGSSDASTSKPRGLTVFAATSLRDAFGKLGESFERTHPGVHVRFNFAGSQELRTQMENGAPVDVFAAADLQQFDAARGGGLVGAPRIFATNEPVIVVPRANPARVTGLADLATVKRLVIGAPGVPIGAYTLQILEKAKARYGADFRTRVEAKVVSHELNVRQVLNKVSLGEADAGIVYRTDARSAKDAVQAIEIPPDLNVIAEYPMSSALRASAPDLAKAFVELVTGPTGQATLGEYGFGKSKRLSPWRRKR
jgi:molybdate transport system substrate-binding protein